MRASGRIGRRPLKRALVRRPSPQLANGIVSHAAPQPVDLRLAILQWEIYVATLQQHGWETIEVPPADTCPDSVFVEDTVCMFDSLAVVANPGALSRRPEIDGVRQVLTDLGCTVNSIRGDGTLDGGDILKVGKVAYVGRTARTNGEGIRQLRAIIQPLGWNVVAVPMTKVLHLKSAITALPDGTIIGWPPALEHVSLFAPFMAMPEEAGAHVVHLGGSQLLVAANATVSHQLLADLGYDPVLVDISEYVKLDGCVTCLSVRMRS